MLHFVEYVGAQAEPTSFAEDGVRRIPMPSVVEDEDGVRMLLLDDPTQIPVRAWVSAHSSGVWALVLADGRYLLTEDFIDGREEQHSTASYRVKADWRGPAAGFLTYAEMVAEPTLAQSEGGFVHMHTHSDFSALDGLSRVSEIVETVVGMGQTAVAITDHSRCAGHPAFQAAAKKADVKAIFGIEANFVDDRFKRGITKTKENAGDIAPQDEARFVLGDYRHLTLWAMNDTGLRNLWAMSTEANQDGFYGRPRMDWDTLARHSEGIMVGTACLRGPISDPIIKGDPARARANLARLMSIFPDRVYVEVHTNRQPVQEDVNREVVALAREYGLPLLAAVDSHYPTKADAETHRVWIAVQTDQDLQDESDLFAGRQDYSLLSEEEVREALSYLDPQTVDEAVHNTVVAASRCDAHIQGAVTTPVFSKKGGVQRDVDRLTDLCLGRWGKVRGKAHSEREYMARFEREMNLLIEKSFCGYMLMVADYCLAAKEGRIGGKPIVVGPGRGSGGGSLVGYLAGITDVDPVDADLLFERFLTEGRVSLPDFDVDFPTSAREALTAYVIERYGEDFVARVGSHIRLKSKGVFRDLARVFKNTLDIYYLDIDTISKIIEEAEADSAGLGLSWEDLMVQSGDLLEPYRQKYPRLFDLAEKMVGRLKTYGKHASGVVIATDGPLTGRIPMRHAEGGLLVTEFDFDALESLGLVKFDLLTVRTLDTLQSVIDSVRETTGRQIDVYGWREEYDDPQVWDELCEGHTLGVFQIETRSGTKLTKRYRPRSLHDLADVLTLVRPGPMRSGLTETYFRRKNGTEEVSFPDPRLEKVLSRTYGTLLYQEDIMATTMVLAGYNSNEADTVRKILGKKQVEKVEKEGQKFVKAAVERGMPQDAADHLWEQMAEFARYSFNRAHAYGYAICSYWMAWFKVHYPAQFLASVLSTVDKERIPEFVAEARRQGYRVLPPDINISGTGFAIDGLDVRYGLDKVKGIGDAARDAILQGQPYTSFDDFMARKGSAANSGVVRLLAAVGAFDSLDPHRKALERRIAFEENEVDVCTFKDTLHLGPGGLPCRFDWAHEVDPPTERKRVGGKMTLVPKAPPKRCTKACRNFTAPVLDLSAVGDYTDADIRAKEMDLLGIYLSSTPFDIIPQEILDNEVSTGEEVDLAPNGEYVVAGIVMKVRTHMARNNKEMAFITLLAQTSEIDVTVFSDKWATFGPTLKPDALCFAFVNKNDRGLTLVDYQPL